jgi:diguanylate cyclase
MNDSVGVDGKHISTLRREAEQFRSLVANVPGIVYRSECREPWRMFFISDYVESLLGYQPNDFLEGGNVTFGDLLYPEDHDPITALLDEVLEGQETSYSIEYRLIKSDSSVVWVQEQGRVIRDEGGRPLWLDGVIFDASRRKAAEDARDLAEAELRHQALYDGLTGLPNRMHFTEHLDQTLRGCHRAGDELAVLMLDLDRFKEINDTLGHAAGDVVLQGVASRLASITREGDLIARLGGDEFALLLPHSGEEGAVSVAERVVTCVVEPIAVEGVLLNVDISTGLAVYPRDGSDADSLVRRADVAMYAAKRRNAGFVSYHPSLDHHEPDQLALVGELRGGLERGELVLYYQPILDLSTGQVPKVEALVRWSHPQRGLVPPDQFIPLVREMAIVTSLTRYVLDRALDQCVRWRDEGREIGVAVNVAMRDLIDVAFPQEVAELLAVHSVPPRLLSLEITEQSVMADPHRTRTILSQLSAMGVHLSIDDFGTGFSSLTYLTHLPVDEVKIDRSFVTNMANAPGDEAIVRSTIELAKNLGKQVVGEGVETAEILEHLRWLGCNAAQGYYLSLPLPSEELDQRIWSPCGDHAPI